MMLKKLYLTTTLLLAISAIFSCKKNDLDTQGAAPGKINLTSYFQIDPANPQQQGFVQALEAFEMQHQEVKFEHEYATGESFHQKFQAMAASKQLPDLYTVYVGKRTAYITETGLTMDLNNFITAEFKNKFSAATWEKQGRNNEIYTIPPSLAVTHAFYVNTRLLDELDLEEPETYEELKAQVPAILAAGYYPVSLGNKDQWPINSWLLSLFVHRLGANEYLDAAQAGRASFTDREFVDSLSLINNMIQSNIFSPGINQMSNTEADDEFYQQKSVYLIDAAWRVSAMVKNLPEEQQNAIQVRVFPKIMGEITPGSSVAVPSEGFGMKASLDPEGQKAKSAWEFIQFYTGEEGAMIRLENGEIPTYKLDYTAVVMPPLQKQLAEFILKTSMGYVIDAQMDPEGMGLLNPEIQAMMFGNLTPEEVATHYEEWVSENESTRSK